MTKHVLVEGKYSRWNKALNRREEYNSFDPEHNTIEDLTEEELKSLGSKVKKVEEASKVAVVVEEVKKVEVAVTSSPETPPANNYSNLLSDSVKEIESALKGVSDIAVLDEIQRAETAGRQRLGVLRVIKSRRGELEK